MDAELGLVRVVELATAQDVGKAMNPQAVEGQIEGGTAQGLGLALLEEIQVRDGKVLNASFTDYLLPTILDMPPVKGRRPRTRRSWGAVRSQRDRRASQHLHAPRDRRRPARRHGKGLPRMPVRPEQIVGIAEGRKHRVSPRGSAPPATDAHLPGREREEIQRTGEACHRRSRSIESIA